jgi:sterol desaturase/sphingolipid hydroxylase (fatty acid hydroxylase superfamily)
MAAARILLVARSALLVDCGAYAYHRAVHAVSSASHARHHLAPHDAAALQQASAESGAFVAVGLTVSRATPGLLCWRTVLAYWGLVTAVHPLLHVDRVGDGPYLRWLRAFHRQHHADPGANFGVLTPWWDVLFGTAAAR